jgi:hypothetical protein
MSMPAFAKPRRVRKPKRKPSPPPDAALPPNSNRARRLEAGAPSFLQGDEDVSETCEPRLFASDAAVRHIGDGLIECRLTRPEWTHEAHLAACLYVILERPAVVAERDLPGIIRRFNESVGGVNSDTEGYHETITQVYIRAVRRFIERTDADLPLVERVNRLLCAPEGRRDWPLHLYSPERLFSRHARLSWVEPDL